MLSNIKDTLGNTFGLLMVSQRRNEYREKLKNAIDTVVSYVSDDITEYTLTEELNNAFKKLEYGLTELQDGSRKGLRKARLYAIAWLVTLCATLRDRRFGLIFDII